MGIYPGWKEKLGYTGESSVQAATFDWVKKASAAAFVGSSTSMNSSEKTGINGQGFMFEYQKDAFADLEFGNDVGYFPDGTAYNKAGNAVNHPETIGPDLHMNGSPLPASPYAADIGYFVDGTAINKA